MKEANCPAVIKVLYLAPVTAAFGFVLVSLVVGLANAWRSPAVLTGLALSPVALAAGVVTGKSKKAAANSVVLSGTVLPIYRGR